MGDKNDLLSVVSFNTVVACASNIKDGGSRVYSTCVIVGRAMPVCRAVPEGRAVLACRTVHLMITIRAVPEGRAVNVVWLSAAP